MTVYVGFVRADFECSTTCASTGCYATAEGVFCATCGRKRWKPVRRQGAAFVEIEPDIPSVNDMTQGEVDAIFTVQDREFLATFKVRI